MRCPVVLFPKYRLGALGDVGESELRLEPPGRFQAFTKEEARRALNGSKSLRVRTVASGRSKVDFRQLCTGPKTLLETKFELGPGEC